MASRTYPLAAADTVLSSIAIPQSIPAGISWGLATWSAYAIVEYILLSALVLLRSPLSIFSPEHWRLSSLLFDFYWALGILGGAAAGFLVQYWERSEAGAGKRRLGVSRLPAALTLLAAVQINLLRTLPIHGFVIFTLVISTALSAAILWALRHPDSAVVDWVELHPFQLAFVLLGPTWLGTTDALEQYGLKTKILVVALSLAASFGGNWLFRRRPQWPAGYHFLSGVGLMIVVALTCSFTSGGRKEIDSIRIPATANPGGAPVVLVVFDTSRADHMSLFGYSRKTTPHLVEFAAGAIVFPNAVASADWTLPAHASMFTGVYPSWHGAGFYLTPSTVPKPLDHRLPTMAEILSAYGYSTAAVVANSAFLTPRWGLARGFDRFSVHPVIEATSGGRPFELRHGMRAILRGVMPGSDSESSYRRALEINRDTGDVMEQPAVRDRSFFLFVNYMDSHWPYLAPAPLDSSYLAGAPPLSFTQFQTLQRMQAQKVPISSDYRSRLMAQYDSGVLYQDLALDELLNALKARGLYDRAMIIVGSDHGEAFDEHGVWGHGASVYGDSVNVALIIKYPGQKAGSVVTAPVSHVDLLPTVLDTLGYPAPAHAQGRSLRHLEGLDDRQILAESAAGRALRWGEFKLIVSSKGKREMYDVNRDPGETHDLYGADQADSQRMVAAYNRWLQIIPRQTSDVRTGIDPEELRRLKSLGYVQ